jgi:hypothetical protein
MSTQNPTLQEIISQYLYAQRILPENLLDDRLIRDQNAETTIDVNIADFMTTGAGRYVDVANFLAVRKFLAGEYADKFEAGEYKTIDFFAKVLDKSVEYIRGNPVQTYLGVVNYYLDVDSPDYIDRSYVFGSMQFKINADARFIVGDDGTFKIENIGNVQT